MSDIKSINELAIYDEEARKNIDILQVNKIDDIVTKDYKLVLKANETVKKEIEIPSKIKTVNNVLPDESGNIIVAANQIQEYDEYGLDKGNIHNYINHFSLESINNKDKFNELDVQFDKIEQKADKEEVDIERKRIDTFITLPPGSTTNDARLEDIKIGADNIVYDSPGDAVRTQFTNNNSKIQQNANKNIEQDNRLNSIESKNKSQDIFLNGLLNENNDGRLSSNGTGNHLKLEGSKAGLVTVDSVVGNSLVNLKTNEFKYQLNSSNNSAYFLLTENSTTNIKGTILDTSLNLGLTYAYLNYMKFNASLLKPSTTYTVILNNKTDYLSSFNMSEGSSINSHIKSSIKINQNIYKLTTKDTFDGLSSQNIILFGQILSNYKGEIDTTVIGIFEGDYTNKPIPQQVFTGIQSSFEGNLVTQEMVTAGTELASNLGKYKVNAKVVGKNLVPLNDLTKSPGSSTGTCEILTGDKEGYKFFHDGTTAVWVDKKIKIKPNTYYCLSADIDCSKVTVSDANTEGINIDIYNGKYISGLSTVKQAIKERKSVRFNSGSNTELFLQYTLRTGRFGVVEFTNVQLEEVVGSGTYPTPCEQYFESSHNIYLNSPLLKGDTLDCRSDGVYHVHNMGKVVLNGSENWNTSTTFYGADVSFFYMVLTNGCKNAGKINLLSDIFTPSYTDNRVNVKALNLERIYLGDNLNGLLQIHISNSRLADVSIKSLKTWLQANPITVVYELAEPYEEKISDNKFLLEIANNSTLSVDSNIPCASVKSTYTSNVVSVVKLDKIQYEQDKIALDNAYRMTILEIATGMKI